MTWCVEVTSSPGSPACPGPSQSCAVKHQARPKLFQSVGSELKQTHRVFCPSELRRVRVWLSMTAGSRTVGNGGCGTQAQDRRHFPAHKHNTLPQGSQILRMQACGCLLIQMWKSRGMSEVRLETLTSVQNI